MFMIFKKKKERYLKYDHNLHISTIKFSIFDVDTSCNDMIIIVFL